MKKGAGCLVLISTLMMMMVMTRMPTPSDDINGHIHGEGSVLLFRSAVRRAQNTLKVIQQMARGWGEKLGESLNIFYTNKLLRTRLETQI